MNNGFFLRLAGLALLVACAPLTRADQPPAAASRPAAGGHPPATVTIRGTLTGTTLAEDSLSFVPGEIAPKYYEAPIPTVKITGNTFTVTTPLGTPQMWRLLFQSDQGKMIYRPGTYFLDATTTALTADYQAFECLQVTGQAATEYRDQLIPFFSAAGAAYDCRQAGFDALAWDDHPRFDSTLYAYVQAHPTSYVALWRLIERFSKFGHSTVREQTLARFAPEVQASHPGQTLQQDLHAAPLKQGAPFPSLLVQGVAQPAQPLSLPQAEYTLVDFWFSRCRPCLESFPAWKQLYATYQPQGFEIVGIATDRTADVPLWRKRSTEYGLPWVQYLDENAGEADRLGVYSFPTTVLLDRHGKVLVRGITPAEAETFLAANLGP